MNIKRHAGKILVLIGLVLFAIGIWQYVSLDGRASSLFLAFGIVSLFMCGFFGVFLHVIMAPSAPKKTVQAAAPPLAMRFERVSAEYCPVCHANLGSTPPEQCPECGYRTSQKRQ